MDRTTLTKLLARLCCFASEHIRQQRRASSLIDRQIKKAKMESQREQKLVLLGTGEAGKSTFIKQMRIIHGQGYSTENRLQFVEIIHSNIIRSMQSMLDACDTLGIRFRDPHSSVYADFVTNAGDTSLSRDLVTAIEYLWDDPDIQDVYNRRREYQLPDSTQYYMSELDRISTMDYIPTEQDILRARVATTGIVEYTFDMGTMVFRIVDVGGQRNERRKWFHCFENVVAIIFLAALSEFDQVLAEDNNDNRMRESVMLFKSMMANPWLQKASAILFLNKNDIFEEKIMHSHLVDYFPRYYGPKHDSEAARDFILHMYLKENSDTKRRIYSHFTCATDTENIRVVFSDVKETIFSSHLNEFNMV